MKMNKISTALVGLGLVSAASVAHANTVVYLTGSTAARALIYNLMTTTNLLFNPHANVVAGTNANNSNQIVYEGTISGIPGTTDISCDFTGSEAGIASVANQNLTQDIPLNPNDAGTGTDSSTYPLPGVGTAAAFFQPNGSGGWTAAGALPGGTFPDLSMADTSQAVSRTPNTGSTALVDYGKVGTVPFTLMKGANSGPDSSWTDIINITTAAMNQALADNGALTANYITGNSGDTDPVAVCGRNFGSGTRVNTLLNAASYSLSAAVGQYGFNCGYPTNAATVGTLTFGSTNGPGTGPATTFVAVGAPFASGGSIIAVGNDGFDSGGAVGQNMNVDGNGSGIVLLGYLGISDAQKAVTDGNGGTAGGNGVALQFNGAYESDSGVENGSYAYWGYEHLLGQHGQLPGSNGGLVGTKMSAALISYLNTYSGTAASGNFSSNPSGQHLLIGNANMAVSRSADFGFPTQ
jgi:hypothetical protein